MWSNTMNMRQILWSAFHNCIRDLTNESGFHSREQMTIVTQPFSIEVKDASTELEMDMDLFDLQCNEFIKSKFNEAPLIDLSQVCALRKLSQIEERRSTTKDGMLLQGTFKIFSHSVTAEVCIRAFTSAAAMYIAGLCFSVPCFFVWLSFQLNNRSPVYWQQS